MANLLLPIFFKKIEDFHFIVSVIIILFDTIKNKQNIITDYGEVAKDQPLLYHRL